MAPEAHSHFIIKAEIFGPIGETIRFSAQKTMYGGKRIAEGDTVFLIASENTGGRGLIARGIVASATPVARKADLERQTPRVSVTVAALQMAVRTLGRSDVKPFSDWQDGQPQTEINFKLYRQGTDKIVGITPATAAFLEGFF
jgi:hypothetical protein